MFAYFLGIKERLYGWPIIIVFHFVPCSFSHRVRAVKHQSLSITVSIAVNRCHSLSITVQQFRWQCPNSTFFISCAVRGFFIRDACRLCPKESVATYELDVLNRCQSLSISVNHCTIPFSMHNSTTVFAYHARYEPFSSVMRAAYPLKKALLLMNLMFSIAVNRCQSLSITV